MEVRDCKHFLPFSEHETDKILIFSLESYFVQEKIPTFLLTISSHESIMAMYGIEANRCDGR